MSRMHLRLISLVVTLVAIGLSQAGFGSVRQIRFVIYAGLGAAAVCLWLAPYFEKWWATRNKDKDEALRLIEQGRVGAAEELLETAWATASKRKGTTANAKLKLLLPLAEAQRLHGKLDQAMQTLDLAVDLAPANPKIHESRARIHTSRKHYLAAAEAWRAAIKLIEAKPPVPASVAQLYCELGQVLRQAGKDGEANESLQKALAMTERAVGPDHADTGRILALLGAGYQQEGNVTEALACLERAVTIQDAAQTSEAPEAATALFHLALAQQESGNAEAAAAAYERVLHLRERMVAGDAGELALVLFNLGNLYAGSRQFARAEELLLRCVSMLQGHPTAPYASALGSLGNLYEGAGRLSEAEPKYRDALAVWEAIGGLSAPETIRAHQQLAALLHGMGRAQESAEVMERVSRWRTQAAPA